MSVSSRRSPGTHVPKSQRHRFIFWYERTPLIVPVQPYVPVLRPPKQNLSLANVKGFQLSRGAGAIYSQEGGGEFAWPQFLSCFRRGVISDFIVCESVNKATCARVSQVSFLLAVSCECAC